MHVLAAYNVSSTPQSHVAVARDSRERLDAIQVPLTEHSGSGTGTAYNYDPSIGHPDKKLSYSTL